MTNEEEKAYIQGRRSAWTTMLGECIDHLDPENKLFKMTVLMKEREGAVAALKILCHNLGLENDWAPKDHLVDIIHNIHKQVRRK